MYLELAKKYLQKAKICKGKTRQYFINLCQVCLAKQGAAPEDIGITKQALAILANTPDPKELGQTRRLQKTKSDPAIICKKYLQQCRDAQGASRQYYANLCMITLAKIGFSAEQIGTSQQELHGLKKRGLLECAAKYLQDARKSKGAKRKCYADLCMDYLGKANASLQEIGCTDEEFDQICI